MSYLCVEMMKKNLTVIFLANAFALLSGVATSLLTAWALGAEGRGDLAVIVLYPNIIALAVGLGMPQGTRYFVASAPEKLSSLFPNAVYFAVTLGLLALVAAEFVVPSVVGVRSGRVMWLVSAYLINIPFALLYDMMAGMLEGSRQFKWAAVSRIVFFGIQCVAYTILWLTGHLTIANAALTMVVAQIANTTAAFLSVVLVLKPGWNPSFRTFKETVRFGLKYHLGVVTSFTTLRLDQMLLVGLATSVEMGLYVIAVRLSEIMTVLASSVSEVLMPEVASSNSDDRSLKLLSRSLRLTLYVFGILMVPLLIVSPYVLEFAFGSEFVAASSALRILFVASMIWSAGAIVNSGLNGLGYPGLSTLSRLSSAVITVITLLVWLPRYGILGAALSSLAGYSAMLGVALFWLTRKKKLTLREIFCPQRNDIPMKEISSFLGWPSAGAASAQPEPRSALAHKLFERNAALYPDRMAITSKEGELTYRQLNERANQLAWYLRSRGAGPESLIPICADRSADMAIGILGILKSGAAYVPIDPAYPADRIANMLADIKATLAVTQSGLLAQCDIDRVCIDTDRETIDAFPTNDPPASGSEDNLAYVIFTSGSTGRPKGAMLTNGNLAHYVSALQKEFCLTPTDNYLHLASIGFSSSRRHLLVPLSVGAGVVIADEDQRLDPIPLFQLIKEKNITIFDAVPSFQRHCLRAILELDDTERQALLSNHLRLIVSASEPLYSDIPKTWIKDLRHPAEHIHMLGQTETSGIIAINRITEKDIEGEISPISIGKAIANTEILLLDNEQRHVENGEVGEMYVAGAGVGRGYIGQEGLSAGKFVDLALVGRPPMRYCRTGDFARVAADDRLQCMGRNDFQVKIRGNRVELGEIEALLLGHESVQNCAVIGREDMPGDMRLVAYVVAARPENVIDELRSRTAEALPDYMRPLAYVLLESLPLTPNGKVDRNALPAPETPKAEALPGDALLQKESELIRTVAAIWAEVLSVPVMGQEDDFFLLGGHSLTAGRTVSRVRSKLGVQIPIRSIFEAPTLRAFAQLVASAAPKDAQQVTSRPAERPEHLPLSFAQQRIWFLSEMDEGLTAYNECEILKLAGTLDKNAIAKALHRIVLRHEALRTRFVEANGQPCQVIVPQIDFEVEHVDLTADMATGKKDAAMEIARELAASPFDLTKCPLFKFTLVQTAKAEHYLIAILHHTISDQWTVGVLTKELDAFYAAEITGAKAELPELPIQYADYSVSQQNWLQTAECQKQLAFWRTELAGAPNILELPTDHPRPAVQRYVGRQADAFIPTTCVEKLNDLCSREGVTPFMALLAIWQLLLYRYSGQDQIVIGTPIAGRTSVETEDLIGFFVNTLAIRADLSGEPTFRELLQRTKERALDAYTHQELPFEKLVEEINPERSMSYTPLFQVMFTVQNTPPSSEKLGDLSLSRLRLPKNSAKFDLSLDVFMRADGFNLQLEFNTDLYEPETAERILGHFRTILASVIVDPGQKITAVNLLTDAELEQIVGEWNSDTVEVPPVCLHDLFSGHASKKPDNIAVVFGDESITYGELDRRANQLARVLQKKGVVPEQIVGIYLSRSIDMIVAVLGVMKAGGAYLPMDPNYPLDRLQYMLTEADVSVMITTLDLHLTTSELAAETVICVDRDRELISSEPSTKPATAVGPENLIYVTFTSGSTGRAKGVMIEHRNVVNVFEAWEQSYHLSSIASHLQMASFSFDVFTGDLSRALCAGAKLVLCPTEVLLDPAHLYRMLCDHDIEAAEFVPAVIRPLIQYLETEGKKLDFLKLMVVGSDTWQADEYRRLQKVCGPNTRVINSYGVTEATIDSTYFEMPDDEEAGAEFVPIGRPFANTQIYLLDQFGNPVPVGVPGELYQGGKGLARGYLNRPDLTAEKFVEVDLPTANGIVRERLYRTGDLARYRTDGNIAIIGRADNQIKLRGYRIELGEIESVLSRHEDVKECIVALRQDVPGEKRLIAYLTTRSGTLDPSELRSFLRGSLPDFMLPSGYVLMTEWKLTPNGKIDRKQLPVPDRIGSTDESSYVAPKTEAELALGQIWADLLRVDKVGVDDNFFELGGHSLLATQTVSRIRDLLGCEVPLRALFETPTVREIAARIEEAIGNDPLAASTTEEEEELERLLAEIESVSDEEAERYLTHLDSEYSETRIGNK